MITVKCNSYQCHYNNNGFCKGENGYIEVDGTENNDDPTEFPICSTVKMDKEKLIKKGFHRK